MNLPIPAIDEHGPSTTDGQTACDKYDAQHGTFKDDDVSGVSEAEQWGTDVNPVRNCPSVASGMKQQ